MFHNVRQSLLLNKPQHAKLTSCAEIFSQHVLVPVKLAGMQKQIQKGWEERKKLA